MNLTLKKFKRLSAEDLAKVLDKHKRWVSLKSGGEYADLSRLDLSGTDLSDVNLSCCNLMFLDLTNVKLTGASLSRAITDKKYLIVSCIGSRSDVTIYCVDDDLVICGCWNDYRGGTIEEFEKRI